MKRSNLITLLIVTIILAVSVVLMSRGKKDMSSSMDKLSFAGVFDEIVSEQGVHYHPQLSIYDNGQKQDIPADIGIGPNYQGNKFYDPMMDMTDIHTHDSGGVLHWEVMEGPTKKGHLRLGNFFEIWGKPFDSSGQNIEMFVNGQPNSEFENYLIKDGDDIEIRYDT